MTYSFFISLRSVGTRRQKCQEENLWKIKENKAIYMHLLSEC